MDDQFLDIDSVVTICDADGKILSMNPASIRRYEADGGAALIGKSLFDCHSAGSVSTIKTLIAEGRSNTYTIERAGVKKLVYQAPWHTANRAGEKVVGGLMEIVIPLPAEMRNIVRR